ncbi:MAG TPA: ATP-binding cassette domain-containing protein, partial [Gammaproteobacteria bacterium]|nr:ATP-binding cassette domain-containing protein [Gammaproteobacteria bacterium]
IRCINRLEKPTSGSIVVNRYNITELKENDLRLARRQMGMIFQHFNLLNRRNVFENISLPLELAGYSTNAIREKIEPLIELTELSKHVHKYPKQLSGGQKQRVAIARALAPSPKVLLSDEATSALDPTSTQAIFELLRSINQELGITILLITHEMDVVKAICDRVAIIHDGSIIEQGSVLELFANPKTQHAKEFIKASSRMEAPTSLKEKMRDTPSAKCGTILRISYHGESASQPIIGFLIQKYHITINIIQGNIEIIRGETMGIMIVEITGPKESVQKSIEFLEKNHLRVEILGYVDRNS